MHATPVLPLQEAVNISLVGCIPLRGAPEKRPKRTIAQCLSPNNSKIFWTNTTIFHVCYSGAPSRRCYKHFAISPTVCAVPLSINQSSFYTAPGNATFNNNHHLHRFRFLQILRSRLSPNNSKI